MTGWLQGYALTTYDYLVENMGEPEKLREGSYEDNPLDKSSVKWKMTSFYVYDWKEETTPKGLHYWHIGGTSKQALKDFEDITGIPATSDPYPWKQTGDTMPWTKQANQ